MSCGLGSLKCSCKEHSTAYADAEFLLALLRECKQKRSLPRHYLPMSLLAVVPFCSDALNLPPSVTYLVSFCVACISAKIMPHDFSIPSVLAPRSKESISYFLNRLVSFEVLTFSVLPFSNFVFFFFDMSSIKTYRNLVKREANFYKHEP